MSNSIRQVAVVSVLIGGILCLHYFTFSGQKYHHALYRMLFYLPLVLGSFWFGMKGAVGVSAAVSIFYLPYIVTQWRGLSFDDFDRLLEMALYVTISFLLGILVEKERKHQMSLVRTESLAAIGRALSEVAHDMKTPLIAIGGFANQISKKMNRSDPNRKKLDVIVQETVRLEALVMGMLEFSRGIQLQKNKWNLNELVLESFDVAGIMAKEFDVRILSDLEPSLPSIDMDAARVKQVLLNLIANGIQASKSGAQVCVKTRRAKSGVLLEVIDHGCGITEDNGGSVFDPFISTKKKGNGLGLAIVKKIVDAHGGEIFFHPNPEKGVTFSVQFPS